jgi:molecular chaperone DnaK (HSP70)
MKIFSAKEVIAQVEGLQTVKTLNRWRKIVEEHFDMEYFRHNTTNENLSLISYSEDEIKKFQLVAQILSEQPNNRKSLQQALETAFSYEQIYENKKTDIEILEEKFNSQISDCVNENKQFLRMVQEINQRLVKIEGILSSEKESRFKLFRRK